MYKGLEYQHIQHNRAPSYGVQTRENQIVSQSKIIIPRGIINFNKQKGHSVSVERSHQGTVNNQEPQRVQITFNEVDHELPNLEQLTNEESQGQSQERTTFMLEPRDESLFRKKKVIEILKTF
jgi:hypothetical protein